MDDMSEYMDAYKQEAEEHLQSMNTGLLALEKDPANKDAIYQIFRAAHTLKSMSATMEFNKIAEMSHELENLFDLIRGKKLVASEDIISLTFACFDFLGEAINNVSEGKEQPDTTELTNWVKLAQTQKDFKFDSSSVAKTTCIAEVSSIKVPVARLDSLLNLAGELISTKTRLDQIRKKYDIAEIDLPLAHLDRLSEQIREDVMRARMMPLEQVFSKFPRMVRDTAKEMGKEVDLKMEGTDVEMDRTVLDQIDTPLVHILRNSISHGIEKKEDRRKQGKKSMGLIKLSARKEREFVLIEIYDDGAGLDYNRIKKKGLERNLLTEEQASKATPDSLKRLLFHPDFSTAEEVTETSGRGIGLNVVKEAVESLGGSLTLDSELGKWTKFTMKLPASVAMIRLLMVSVGCEIYAIPLSNIERVLKINTKDIKTLEGNETIIYQEEDIPVFRLSDIFNVQLEGRYEEETIVLVESGLNRAGLVVNSIVSEQESLVKPIKGFVKGGQYFTGATILADGKVVLITDVPSVIG